MNPIITQAVGVLVEKNAITGEWAPFCTATRIGKNTILTARHCYFTKEAKGRPSRVIFGTSFVTQDGPEMGFRIRGLTKVIEATNNEEHIKDQDDYLLLAADFPEDYPYVNVSPLYPSKKQLLLAVSLFIYAIQTNVVSKTNDHHKTVPPKPLAGMLRLSESSACFVREVSDSCIFHGCQSQVGSSGAPLFLNDKNSLQLVGMHVSIPGGMGCGSSQREFLDNVGIIPKDLFSNSEVPAIR